MGERLIEVFFIGQQTAAHNLTIRLDEETLQMENNMKANRLLDCLPPVLVSLACSVCPVSAPTLAGPQFGREEIMLMNLNKGAGSAGYYMLTALRQLKEINKELDKAERQVGEVDKAYAKSRGKPDDRYLATSQSRLAQARQTAAKLEEQVRDAYYDLKSSIQQTLVTAQ